MIRDHVAPVADRVVARWGDDVTEQLAADLLSFLLARLQLCGVNLDALTPEDFRRLVLDMVR